MVMSEYEIANSITPNILQVPAHVNSEGIGANHRFLRDSCSRECCKLGAVAALLKLLASNSIEL